MAFGAVSLSFDFTFNASWLDGKDYRRFTTQGFLSNGAYVPAPITLTSSVRAPIVLNRVGAGTTDGAFGTLGRCGFRASRTFSGGAFNGWAGAVVTHLASDPATPQNSTIWDGRAVPIGQSSAQVWYFARPFRANGFGQTNGAWTWDVGISCGNICASMIGVGQSGCPIGDNWGSGGLAGEFTYFRGKVRSGAPTFGSLSALVPPQWDEREVDAVANSYPQNPFEVVIS